MKVLHQNRRKCDVCGIICHGKRAFNAHKKTHDLTEHRCEDCSTVCKSKQALLWHKQKDHGYKIFNCKCTICDETFSNGWSLYWHKKRKHGVIKKEDIDESQEKVTLKAESLESPKLSISEDSSIDVLQSISGKSCLFLLHSFLAFSSRHQPVPPN